MIYFECGIVDAVIVEGSEDCCENHQDVGVVQLREITVEPGLLRRLARCLTLVGPLANGSCEVVDEQVDALFQVKVFPSSTLHDSVDKTYG